MHSGCMETESQYSKHASLALIGRRFETLKLWAVVQEEVTIKQKVVQYEPLDKLLDCLINILAGGRGLIEINTRVRSDQALQRAFGRSGCAEQSTVSQTLDACTSANVRQMRTAMKRVVQQHGQVMQHPAKEWLLLDVDTVGLVAGEQGEEVSKGYFSGGRDQRGRQLGRVLATGYDEVIVERLYAGTRQLEHSLLDLVAAAEDALHLGDADRADDLENIVWRIDAGGGTDDNINPLLRRGYQVLTKAHNWRRAVKLAASVQHWECDPKTAQRDVGWVTSPHAYVRPTRQLVIRTVTKKGKIRYRVLICSLSDEQLCECFKLDVADVASGTPWPLLYAYDLRGGGIETQNRCDKQGLGLGHRNKRSFAAQEMLVLLGQLAHLFLIWMRNELALSDPHFAHYGLKRMVRDVCAIDGIVHFDRDRNVIRVDLNSQHPLSAAVSTAFESGYV